MRHRQPDDVIERELLAFVPHPIDVGTQTLPGPADVAMQYAWISDAQ